MYGSEYRVINKKKELKMNVVKMRVLGWMCDVTRLDILRNQYIRGNFGETSITGKMRENKLKWFRHIKRKNYDDIVKKISEVKEQGKRKFHVGI